MVWYFFVLNVEMRGGKNKSMRML